MITVGPGRGGDLGAMGPNLCANGHHALRCGAAPPGVVPLENIDTEELRGSDHDGVGGRLHLHDVSGLAAGGRLTKMEATTLPDCECVGTRVLPKRVAVGGDELAGLPAKAVGPPPARGPVGDGADVGAARRGVT